MVSKVKKILQHKSQKTPKKVFELSNQYGQSLTRTNFNRMICPHFSKWILYLSGLICGKRIRTYFGEDTGLKKKPADFRQTLNLKVKNNGSKKNKSLNWIKISKTKMEWMLEQTRKKSKKFKNKKNNSLCMT